jgi:hypothetical protein
VSAVPTIIFAGREKSNSENDYYEREQEEFYGFGFRDG